MSQTADAIFGLNTAQNFDQFRTAAEQFAVPSQNLLYADTAGNIGYQAPGRIPIRSRYMVPTPRPASGSGPGWVVVGLEGLRAVRVRCRTPTTRPRASSSPPTRSGDREQVAVPHHRVGLRLPEPADPVAAGADDTKVTPAADVARSRATPAASSRRPWSRPLLQVDLVRRRLHQAGAGPAARLGLHQPGRRQRVRRRRAAYYNAVWCGPARPDLQRRAAHRTCGPTVATSGWRR